MAGNRLPGWDYAHCLPYFRRMETFSGGGDAWRGDAGPVFISRCRAAHKLYDRCLRAGQEGGHTITKDHKGYRQEGFHVAQAFIRRGRRWSSASGCLHPATVRANLAVWSRALVRRLRVIDASIMPRTVTANPSAPIMMMAERLSDRVTGQALLRAGHAAFYRSAA